jgi:hypothetical protein
MLTEPTSTRPSGATPPPNPYWSQKGWQSPYLPQQTETQVSKREEYTDPQDNDSEEEQAEDDVWWEEELQTDPDHDPPPVPEPAKFRKYNLRILSWNIVGTQSKDRMRALGKVMRKYKPDVILLQEIHRISKAGIENLHSFLPNYNWILNWGPNQKRGVGVGVRNNTSTTFPLNKAYRDKEGNIIAVDFTLRGRDCRAISICKVTS